MSKHLCFKLLTFLTISILFIYCKTANKTKPDMPKLSPNSDYSTLWKSVDTLEQQGLYKSALEQVDVIAAKAKAERNTQQSIKSLIFKGKYTTMLDEDGLVKAIQFFENEEKSATQPEKSVVQSMLAQLYNTYLQNQGWNLSNRTPIPDGEGGDILTWSAAQIEKRALDLYAASVTEEALLKSTPIELLSEITTVGSGDTVNVPLRPTLYDLLAHRALDHFSNERSYLTEPAFKFYLDNKNAFAPAKEFVNQKFESQDKTSGKWLAVNLFQKIIVAHLTDKDAAALIDVDLKRLKFAQQNSTLEDKTALFLAALETLHKQHFAHPSDAEIVAEIADVLMEMDGADPKSDGSLLKRTVTECEDAIRRHPNTLGAKRCAVVLQNLRQTSLNMEVEQINLPEKPILASVSYKNLSKVWVRIVHLPADINFMEKVQYQDRMAFYRNMEVIKSTTWDLTDPKDFKQHRTETAIDGLPIGHWGVLVSDNADFDENKGTCSFTRFAVSRLAVVHFRENGITKFVVADRLTGAPMAGVTADFFKNRYDYQTYRNAFDFFSTAKSDQNGLILANLPQNEGISPRFSLDADTIWTEQTSNYEPYKRPGQRTAQFFADRAIYRPGQQVYFKAIVLDRDAAFLPSIVPNAPLIVKFFDANGQEKGVLNLRTNDFGTANGVFTAPMGGLTGSMSIVAQEGISGTATVQVEEYKRPKFEVTFKPIEGAFRVNDNVTAKGEAKNYAGVALGDVQVRYRVVRQARYPMWDYGWWRPAPRRSESMEIANGTTTTNADGTFEVKFVAQADPMVPKKDQPTFDFTVYVDVTDITGETRSSEATIAAGYLALNVDLGMGSTIEMDSLKKVVIKTTNNAGQKQAAKGDIVLQRLVEPKQVFNNRFWEKPDVWSMKEAEFKQKFPDYAWKDEDNPEKWGREDYVIPFQFDTEKSNTIDLNNGKVMAGWYALTLKTQDKFGEKIEIKRIIRVWTAKDRKTQFTEPTVVLEKETLQPGESAKLWLGSKGSFKAFMAVERGTILENPRWVDVNGVASIDLPIKESDRGGLFVHFFAVRNNRFYGLQPKQINVPWSNKDLNITFETFRDKLAPGQQEEWRIKISGDKKEKVAAEMVAAMYDASLDQFVSHAWSGIYFPNKNTEIGMNGNGYGAAYAENFRENVGYMDYPTRIYQDLNWFDFPMYGVQRAVGIMANFSNVTMKRADKMEDSAAMPAPTVATMDIEMAAESVAGGDMGAPPPPLPQKPVAAPPAPIRRNLQETVFFFPELRTDKDGNVIVKFTMNEALTRWKFLAFAHTKQLQSALAVKEVVTQKDLMVIANPPRFVREGDEIEFTAKVSNLSQQDISGTATLNLLDAVSLQPVENVFGMAATSKDRGVAFSIKPGQSQPVSWKLKVPFGAVNGLTWQIFADGKNFRDGEESTIPVVTNRQLVTETLPITVRGNQTKSFVFENLKNNASNTLKTERFTLEFTSNPVWYVVQALPYLMEYPHECSEQIFSRYYANTLASSVTQKMPNVKRVFEKWKGTDAMKSNLAKNQELKTALLEETPWVLDAQSEEQQKQNIALLFDLNRMADEQRRALATLAERQTPNGGWPWFPGAREDWYITQYIVEGMGHLQQLGAIDLKTDDQTRNMVDKALGFCDQKMREYYAELEKSAQKPDFKWEGDHLNGMIVHYLYARSFFGKLDKVDKQTAFFLGQAEKYWLGKGLYQEGLLALALHRAGRTETAQKIANSLRERALQKEELGMYWPYDAGYYWYQMPIETQSLMVEVFDEVANDRKAVEELRIWLLKNKQTNRWESTKATAEAVYALLLHGDNWLNNTKPVQVSLGGKTLKPTEVEAGTGYFKQTWPGKEVKNNWSDIKVENPNSNITWGAAYWQYFEDLDKIKTFQKTPLTIVKQLFREENSATGPVLTPIAAGASLKVGDKIKVRIEIRVDRAMEYVHLKDMRASGFEPVNVLSSYKYQGGLGYYESTKDLATHFFMDYLPRGTFVFEYPLVVSQKGNFSNGITTMQCMYAPEFTTHSEGIRVSVQ